MNFGKNLRQIRKSLKLTQMELANLMNVSQRSISHYEHGDTEPELITLCRLATALDVPIDALIAYDYLDDEEAYFELAKIVENSNITLNL